MTSPLDPQQQELAESLLTLPAQEFLEQAATSDDPVWHEWHTRFRHLSAYGHMVYNLDFMNPVPADDPVPLLETLRFFVNGKGSIRTSGSGASRPAGRRRRHKSWRGSIEGAKAFRRLLHWAESAAPVGRMRSPMSGWRGRRCAACSSRSVGDSSAQA